MRARAILIAGPTASGKSALALELARRRRGAVVNADSMQVYRDLRTVTARPTIEEEAAAPHLLFGHVDAATNYSVGRWLEDLPRVLRDLAARELTPILVGGTGMYFRAALYGLSDIPAVPGEVREAMRAWAQTRPLSSSCRTRRATGNGRSSARNRSAASCCGLWNRQRRPASRSFPFKVRAARRS
jgi:tRNA dimethylallyltransferase